MLEIVEKLTSLSGPCGYEHNVSYYIRDYVKDLVDEVRIDGIGNVIAVKKGSLPGPKVLLTAHMDEVGFIVKKVEENGLLRFEKLGGHDDRILLAQQVKVLGNSGEIYGVIGTMSAHFVKFDDPSKVRKHSHLYIDIGASSKAEVEEMGIEVGAPVTWATEMKVLGPKGKEMIMTKSLDDRAGCAVLLQLINELQKETFAGEVTLLFSVQEEVGLRGAETAIKTLDVDAAIAIDTTAVSDTPEETMDKTLFLGKGTGIKVMDFSLIVHKTMKNHLVNLAKENGIAYQLEIFPGIGTDGGAVALANNGVPTGVLSIPSRYAHSPIELVSVADLEATKELAKAFVLNLTEHTSFEW
ncbi:M42 family metallopeptidase [Heyndrickxia camelliae]|uniref:Endoglucanase n=1 Tax=Heyndrickxia camelliae TaxID=1707093 RepID=A0A2N3LIU9_9BACI|nr:M42 family metallopeptidase [Heyndrickxia camelliae]PKR84552.1 endoglucanase [Heyndrickxia camelliae]